MATGSDHHREKPTQQGASDKHNRTNPASSSSSSGRANTSGRPHATPQGGSSKPQQSLSEQLQSVIEHQSQQSSQSSQPQSQWASSSQAGSSSNASSSHTSQPGQPSQTLPGAGTGGTGIGGAGNTGGSQRGCLMPLIIGVIFILIIGGFGGSCMLNPGSGGTGGSSIFGGGTTGGNTPGAPSTNGTYTISSDLGNGNANDTWTVLMYVCGSDLESTSTRMGGGLATGNLVELTQAKLGNNVNYVIETGGAKKWQNDTVSARYLERYEMKDGYMTQVEQVPSASMAESSTLADFLNWGVKKYPADHYMLVIWDHGGGSITGVCLDDLYPYTRSGEADSLTLTEMRDAMQSCGTTFDVIGFDTCLMATLETAEILSPYASYMVASEESEPGTGWDYTQWPTWLASHPGTSGADLGTVICETYYNKCANVGAASTATLSTIDLSKIKAVSTAFQNASDDIALATVDTSSLRKLYQGAGKAESYGNQGMLSMNMVDLGDLMNRTRDVIGSDADAVTKAIDDAIVFEAHRRNRSKASGLSVYYPLQITDKNDFYKYAEITSNTPYLQFLGVMYGVYDKYDWTTFDNYVSLHGEPVNENKIGIDFTQTVLPDGHVQLQVTQGLDQVAQVSFEMYVYIDQLDILCYLGSDNDMTGSYETGEFTDNFQCDWLTIDGNYVSATLSEQGDGYNLYYIPINLNGERTGMVVEYDYSTNEYGVVCLWDENNADTGMAGRTGNLLQEGDQIEFLFPAANVSTGAQDVIPLGTMTWHEDPTITYEGLGDGTFAFRFDVTDVLGNEHKSDLVFEKFVNSKFVEQTR